MLPVPELLPMRLTPQLLALLEPLTDRRGGGLPMRLLTRVLRLVAANSTLIADLLAIFLQDPSLDWTVRLAAFVAYR